jgi:hypothetical protein
MGRPRRRTIVLGLLVALPATLLAGLPAAAWLTHQHLHTGGPAWSSSQTHGAQVASAPSVKISGTTKRLLRPGLSARIDLRFSNPGPDAITLRHVRVTISRITAPQADAGHPCTVADFRVRPMRAGSFVLPRGEATDLLSLGIPAWQWPHIKMRNRPVNQDGCKDASLTLSYRGYRGLRMWWS